MSSFDRYLLDRLIRALEDDVNSGNKEALPYLIHLYTGHGVTLHSIENYTRAHEMLGPLVDQDDADAMISEGFVFNAEGDFCRAMDLFRRSFKIKKSSMAASGMAVVSFHKACKRNHTTPVCQHADPTQDSDKKKWNVIAEDLRRQGK